MSESPEIKFASSVSGLASDPGVLDVRHGVGQEGDLVVVEVAAEPTGYRDVEDCRGRHVTLYTGDCFVGVFGNRESSQRMVGHVPEAGRDTASRGELHLLSGTGLIGLAASTPDVEPTRVRALGLVWSDGHPANLAHSAYAFDRPVSNSAPIVIVAGTASDIGKTHLTARIVHGLRVTHQCRVAAAKLAGTSGLEDVLQYRDAGAIHALDSHCAGLPSTYTTEARYIASLRSMVHELNAHQPDVILGEVGGDFLGGNIRALFGLKEVANHIVHVVLLALDTVAGVGALYMLEAWRPGTSVSVVVPFCRNAVAARRRASQYLDRTAFDVRSVEEMRSLVDLLGEKCGIVTAEGVS